VGEVLFALTPAGEIAVWPLPEAESGWVHKPQTKAGCAHPAHRGLRSKKISLPVSYKEAANLAEAGHEAGPPAAKLFRYSYRRFLKK
jgi:hypothetical protein